MASLDGIRREALVDAPLDCAWQAVADVCAYPDFLPGCQSVSVEGDPAMPGLGGAALQATAVMKLGVGGLAARLHSEISLHPPRDAGDDRGAVEILCRRPPMRRLRARWRLAPREGGTWVEFCAEVDFASAIWRRLYRASGDGAADLLASAFSRRAECLHRLRGSPA